MGTKEYSRIQRISQEMRKNIAIILQLSVKNPRIGIATISGVTLSRDLSYATVFVTFMNKNTPDQIKTGIFALKEASHFIQRELSKSMRLRVIPKLTFKYDSSLVQGIRILNLVKQIAITDRSCQRQEK